VLFNFVGLGGFEPHETTGATKSSVREIALCEGAVFAVPAWSTTTSDEMPTETVLPLVQPLSVIV
jgi:hypothetical protein